MAALASFSLTETWKTIAPTARPDVRRTKIVCTLGPATSDPETIYELAQCGMDVARLNISHGTHDEHLARLQAVRAAQDRIGRPIAVIADLCGPKIRVAGLAKPVRVAIGDELVLTDPGSACLGEIGVTFPGLAAVVEPGRIVAPAKGVNLPATSLPIPALTAKDRVDLEFALAHDVDYVALSFVRSADDVLELRRLIDLAGSPVRIISKIEKADAVANLDAIIDASDAVMVARGDLGVEIGVSQVPMIQKHVIRRAREAGRAVITATQMLESMIQEPEPTRAEVSDVANAILDGTSAVMLSAETAAGMFPLRAVAVMDSIARSVEPTLPYERRIAPSDNVAEILTHGACDLADDVGAAVIAVPTKTGATARLVSRFRPQGPIVAASTSAVVLQQLALEWAVVPLQVEEALTIEAGWANIIGGLVGRGLAHDGDTIVLTGRSNLPLGGSTNHVFVHQVETGGTSTSMERLSRRLRARAAREAVAGG